MRKKNWKAYSLPSTHNRLPTPHIMPRDGQVSSVSPTVESGAFVTQQDTSPSQVDSTLGKVMKT